MKRDREAVKDESSSSSMAKASSSSSSYIEKGKMWVDEGKPEVSGGCGGGGGMDELLAVLGYKVRSSDMAEVAQQLEQLDMAMGLTMQDGISHLSDTVHYNPSDLSGWVQSMIAGLNTTSGNNFDMQIANGGQVSLVNNGFISFSNGKQFGDDCVIYDDDLRAIPGGAVLCSSNNGGNKENEALQGEILGNEYTNKRMRSISSSGMGSEFPAGNGNSGSSSRAVVLVDSQETGIRLVHSLMACAEAVQRDDMKLADALVKHIGILAVSQAGAMRKVATYFAEALARRIYKIYPQDSLGTSYNDVLEMHFYETCPYLKFAHFTANQAILEAFAGVDRVHVIDFSLKQGMQWPALMQALALRSGGPPVFRLTGIGPPQPDNNDALQEVGWKLAQLANTIGVEFEFKGFVANSLADLDVSILDIKASDVESVAVNSIFELHKLLGRPNAVEKVLDSIKLMKPKIVTIVEQEANHNGGLFQDRFNEALHYYSTMFDSLESSSELTQPSSEDLVMSEVYLGRQICNVLACEGVDRVERHELLTQWRDRMNSCGFDPVSLGSNAYKQASMLLALFGGGDGYRVEENDGCLMLGWHTRPLIATSAWQVRPN